MVIRDVALSRVHYGQLKCSCEYGMIRTTFTVWSQEEVIKVFLSAFDHSTDMISAWCSCHALTGKDWLQLVYPFTSSTIEGDDLETIVQEDKKEMDSHQE